MGNEISRRNSYPSCDDPTIPRIMNNLHPLKFHPVHGDYVTLSKNDAVATRVEGFCKGIVFSHRPVAVNEYIFIKFLDISSSWSGALRIGFTANDPASYRNKLPKYACPFMTELPGNWARALSERLVKKDSVLFYYVNQNGDVHYGFDNYEHGIFFGGVSTSSKLWALLDIYGNTVQVEFIDPRNLRREPQNESLHSANIVRSNRSPSAAISEFGHRFPLMKASSPIYFHKQHGCNALWLRNGSVINRKIGNCGYAFTNRPLKLEEIMIIRISEISGFSERSLIFGVTSCNPSDINCESLPADPDDLLDRSEYWVVYKAEEDVAAGLLAFVIQKDGALMFCKKDSSLSIVAYVDHTLPLWFFIELPGTSAELKMEGSYEGLVGNDDVSDCITMLEENPGILFSRIENESSIDAADLSSNENSNECVICYEARKDCALYRCGHACMCYDCAVQLWHSANPHCPLCREEIADVIRIYK